MSVILGLVVGACGSSAPATLLQPNCDNLEPYFLTTASRDRAHSSFDFVDSYSVCGDKAVAFASKALQRTDLADYEKSELMMILVAVRDEHVPFGPSDRAKIAVLMSDDDAKVRWSAALVLDRADCADCGAAASEAISRTVYAEDYVTFARLVVRDRSVDCRVVMEEVRRRVPDHVFAANSLFGHGSLQEAFDACVAPTMSRP